jgi:hypothetical protein
MMKRLFALSGITLALLAGTPFAHAQSSPPPMPSLSPEQSATVNQRLDAYRQQTERRVARGEITQDEADNLLKWREWQIAGQVAGVMRSPRSDVPPGYAPPASSRSDVPPDYAPPDSSRSDVPPDYYEAPPPRRDYVVVEPPPYYGPYYRYPTPYYWGPYSYWGPSICAGGFGHHVGGRICF